MYLFNLLADASETVSDGVSGGNDGRWVTMVVFGVIIVAFLAYSILSGRKRRRQMEEEKAKRNDIHPGYKVTTIGGIIGVVTEVDDEANTFVLETGGADGKCRIKFDKQAIYLSESPEEAAKTVEETNAAETSETSEK